MTASLHLKYTYHVEERQCGDEVHQHLSMQCVVARLRQQSDHNRGLVCVQKL